MYYITPAEITVIADAKTIVYGEENVPLTYRVAPGLFGDDTLSGSLVREGGDDANEEGYEIRINR